MKERIVNNYGTEIKNICNGCAEGVKKKCNQTQREHLICVLQMSELEEFEVEQVPETWEDLKELCRENFGEITIGVFAKTNKEFIIINLKTFCEEGEILDEDNDVFAQNRTPQQMWQIIKNLIGEE